MNIFNGCKLWVVGCSWQKDMAVNPINTALQNHQEILGCENHNLGGRRGGGRGNSSQDRLCRGIADRICLGSNYPCESGCKKQDADNTRQLKTL